MVFLALEVFFTKKVKPAKSYPHTFKVSCIFFIDRLDEKNILLYTNNCVWEEGPIAQLVRAAGS